MINIVVAVLARWLYGRRRHHPTGPGSAIRPHNADPGTSLTSSTRPGPAAGGIVNTRPPNNLPPRTPRRTPRPWSITVVRVPRMDRRRPHRRPASGGVTDRQARPLVHHGEPLGSVVPSLSLEEVVQQQRRADCRAAVGRSVNVVLAEIWCTGFLATIAALAGQTRERALTLITHPWDLLADPYIASVLWTGSLVVIMTITYISTLMVLVFNGPRYDPAAIRRRLNGD